MARLREKNACPSAFTNVAGVTAEKSGFRKNERPSDALGSVSENAQNISRSTKSTGIITFDIFSIPF